MSPSAQRAQLDFVRLAAEEPSSLYFEQFLRDGCTAWPSSYQSRFPGLATWPEKLIPQTVDDWQPILPCETMQSHIVLIEAQNPTTRGEPAESVRNRWLESGRVVSAYPGDRVRMSIGPVIDSPG